MTEAAPHGQEHVEAAKEATKGIFGPNGWLDQARAAQAKGLFQDFVTKLLATLGPVIGQAILAFITSLLPVLTPPAPAPAKPK